MDTLVAVGTTAAWAYSVAVTVAPSWVHEAGLHPETYFDSSAIVLGLVLLGRASSASHWLAPLAGPAFLAVALWLWRFGVRRYRSTGS